MSLNNLFNGFTTNLHLEQGGKNTPLVDRFIHHILAHLFRVNSISLFVRLFLGKVNVKQYREGERVILKQEYQKFKRFVI